MSVPSWHFVDAIDVLFFRDGRSFEAGEGHVAQSLYPPNGSTVWGAIRGAILRSQGVKWSCYRKKQGDESLFSVGTSDTLGPLDQLLGPWAATRTATGEVELLFPMPADVCQVGDKYVVLQPMKDDLYQRLKTTYKLRPLWVNQPGVEAPDAPFLLADALSTVLNGCDILKQIQSSGYVSDRRAGNALLDNKTVRDGYLYSLSYANPLLNLKPDGNRGGIAFGLKLAHDSQISQIPTLLQLGGENKWATLNSQITCSLPKTPEKENFKDKNSDNQSTTHFKVYLATPTIFKHGWYPDWLDSNSDQELTGKWPGTSFEITLKAVAIKGKTMVGGFDLAKGHGPGESRGSHSAVRAGAVYFFETEASAEDVLTLHGESFVDRDDERNKKLGLGLSLIGRWEYV